MVRIRQHDETALPLLRNDVFSQAAGAEPLLLTQRGKLPARQSSTHGVDGAVAISLAHQQYDRSERARQ